MLPTIICYASGDTTLDEGLPAPKDSILWTADFLGNGNNVVTQGPFANWTTTTELSNVPGMKTLFRGVGDSPFGGQYKDTDIEYAVSRDDYDSLTAW